MDNAGQADKDRISSTVRAALYRRSEEVAYVVVLERFAYGAGNTRWYVSQIPAQLDEIIARCRPGSCVSFYFDGRIARGKYSDEVEIELADIVIKEGDALLGWQVTDDPELFMEVVGLEDLSEMAFEAGQRDEVFFGSFPGRGNDGVDSITVVLPDVDGVVRKHPY